MTETNRPGWAARGERERERAAPSTADFTSSPPLAQPLALAVRKRGRWCIVSKVTVLDGQPILAIAHRHQHGVETCISVPLAVLDYAEARGCRWLYFRDDRRRAMKRIRLADLRRCGWLQGDGEIYIPLANLEPCAWRSWPYATETVRLGGEPQPEKAETELVQLSFHGWSSDGGAN